MYLVHCNRPSKSARALASALRGRKVNLQHGWNNHDDVVINWGDSSCSVQGCLNLPNKVSLASNKLRAFTVMKSANVPVPEFAVSTEDVTWNSTTVVRHKLSGHSGEGIEIVED